jgi:hypothetical protein
MPPKAKKDVYNGPQKEIAKLAKFLLSFSNDGKYAQARAKLRDESTPKPPAKRRQKSKSMMKLLEQQFPALSKNHCTTDISCLLTLFEGALRILPQTKARLKALLQGMNAVTPLQYPASDQLSSYNQQVTKIRNVVKARYPKNLYKDDDNLLYTSLAFAGGSTAPSEIVAFKKVAQLKASKALDSRLQKRIPATEVSSPAPSFSSFPPFPHHSRPPHRYE